jgi:hypothetical protein
VLAEPDRRLAEKLRDRLLSASAPVRRLIVSARFRKSGRRLDFNGSRGLLRNEWLKLFDKPGQVVLKNVPH